MRLKQSDYYDEAEMAERQAELDAMKPWQRFEDLHGSGENGGNVFWANTYDPPKPYWEVWGHTSWLILGLGFEFQREYGAPHWADRWVLSLHIGPWRVGLSRQWNQP